MIAIPSNTATAALRRIPFTLVDATDLKTPEDITVTGVKVTLSFAGGTPAASTNDIVKVSGTNGEYYVELTQAESSQTAGTGVRGYLTPSGCALTKIAAQVAGSDAFATAETADTIADEVQTRTIAAVTLVNGLAANVITAAATATDFTTEIQSGLATAAALATVDDFLDTEVAAILAAVDTEVAAIKAKTDSLTFTVAGVVDANVQRINDTTILGDGSGTPFDV